MLVLLCTVLSSFTLTPLFIYLFICLFIYLFVYFKLLFYISLIAEIKKNRKQAKHKEEQEQTSVIGDLIIQTTNATWILLQ